MNERLIDLDELITRCKEEITQEYIKEAVACYKVGAFRSCIVSTWNAVVFDYLNKLHQLELTGDNQAKEKLKNFHTYRASNNYTKLWEFEVKLPESARKDFEFISSIEEEDLKRLHHDRSRCAHPSMLLDEKPFQPTPELARYHLRNAVTHLLQYPPVHGRVAIARVKSMIESAGFPKNTEEAIKILKDSYLSRARVTLIKDVVIELTHAVFSEKVDPNIQERMYAALGAISQLHFEQFQKVMSDKLLNIIESVEDKDWHRVFYYLDRMQLWDFLKEKQKTQVKTFIQNIDFKKSDDILMLLNALNSTKEFQTVALEKLKTYPKSKLPEFINFITQNTPKIKNDKDFLQQIIQPCKSHVVQSFIHIYQSFPSSTSHVTNLMLVTSWLNNEEIKSILKAFCENDRMLQDNSIPAMMTNLFQKTVETSALLKNEWLLVKEKIKNLLIYTQLLQLINEKFSDSILTLNTNKEGKEFPTT
jgi:hypothetical protein